MDPLLVAHECDYQEEIATVAPATGTTTTTTTTAAAAAAAAAKKELGFFFLSFASCVQGGKKAPREGHHEHAEHLLHEVHLGGQEVGSDGRSGP